MSEIKVLNFTPKSTSTMAEKLVERLQEFQKEDLSDIDSFMIVAHRKTPDGVGEIDFRWVNADKERRIYLLEWAKSIALGGNK